uniref:Flavin-containing monooxygenase n=1 Tax=Culicoides sonorensis TaxID=179676 RepID=A0A336MIW8_CULSO
MKIAVIGAGITGLVSCKYCKEAGFDVVVFEKYYTIGGTWVYTKDSKVNDLSHQTSMYKNLITNSPIEVMGFRDFEFPSICDKSYVSWKEVVEFLHDYAENFALMDFIRFGHIVTKIEPQNDKWRVDVQNLDGCESFCEIFDAIFVCNGHFSTPNMPSIEGIEYFQGKTLHSKEYDNPEMFQDQRVLIIGAGPSGIDLTFDVSKTAKQIALSHHSKILKDIFPANVHQLPDVTHIASDGSVNFLNGNSEKFDAIIFCTGYNYNFPFIGNECGLKMDNNHITPLYKHIMHIEHPTLFFIGMTNVTIFTHLIELQIQFSLKILLKRIELPSKHEMYQELNHEIEDRIGKGYSGRRMHQLWPDYMRNYIDDLVRIGALNGIKPVLLDIYDESRALSTAHPKETWYKLLHSVAMQSVLHRPIFQRTPIC